MGQVHRQRPRQGVCFLGIPHNTASVPPAVAPTAIDKVVLVPAVPSYHAAQAFVPDKLLLRFRYPELASVTRVASDCVTEAAVDWRRFERGVLAWVRGLGAYLAVRGHAKSLI